MADEPKDEGNAEAWQSFGKRRADEAEPAVDPSKPPIKRSQTVSLALLATAGVAALGIGEFDWSQKEEDIVVYADADACITAKLRSETDCRSDYAKARAAYPWGAPRYATMNLCESHHGAGHCVAGETVTEGARGQFVPRMAAYFMARKAEQAVEPEPIYEHQPQSASSSSSSGTGGYCRSGGGRIWTSSGGRASSARVSSASLRRTSFGGFGSTGRSFSSSSRSFFGGG